MIIDHFKMKEVGKDIILVGMVVSNVVCIKIQILYKEHLHVEQHGEEIISYVKIMSTSNEDKPVLNVFIDNKN